MQFLAGLKASELNQIFEKQANEIKLNQAEKFDRNVAYTQVECDVELMRVPLDAASVGLAPSLDETGEALCENFVFSLLLITGTLNQCTIDVPADCSIDPALVLSEAEQQSLNVRVLMPDDTSCIEPVRAYADLLAKYSTLWLRQGSGTYSLSPLDGYLEYRFARALGHTPDQITRNSEMQALFTDSVSDEAMDYVKSRLDQVIEHELGGDEYFREQVDLIASAIHLKNTELRNARLQMLEQELDSRTPVPNLIRAVASLTGLAIPDAAGMVYEIKHGIHTVLDKYLPRAEGDDIKAPSPKQLDLASGIGSAFVSALGGQAAFNAVWGEIAKVTQLKSSVDVDRGVEPPSEIAVKAADSLGVEPKVAALAIAELTGMFGSILKAGKAIETLGIEKPAEVKTTAQSNIIAVG
tara:strand:- start:67974 stop:69206 length:1233 start_codon:yes stop_codon:yes gene_type:complete